MIEVHVVDDAAKKAAVCEKQGFDCGHALLAASENGEETGYVSLRMRYSPEEAAVDITGMTCPDADIGEMLVRSAVSYGERRGAEAAYAVPDAWGSEADLRCTAFKRAGFKLEDGVMSVSVGSVVHVCESCAAGHK